MEFTKASKYFVGLLATVGVVGLFLQIGSGLGSGEIIPFSHDFGRLNSARLFLIAWETFWLSSIAIFFIYVATRAKSGKSEHQVENLENYEPLIFKIIIGGLIIAAILTLLVPAFAGDNVLPHYNTNDDGTEIEVIASQFAWTIDGTSCDISDQPEASCATFEVGERYIFLLESIDTTHGFTIYDDNNVLIIQAQVVPGYVTRLAFTFDHPGDYSIRCAEYCGQGHQTMLAAFNVTEAL